MPRIVAYELIKDDDNWQMGLVRRHKTHIYLNNMKKIDVYFIKKYKSSFF